MAAIAAVPPALMVAGTLLSAFSQVQQGQAQYAIAKAQSGQLRYNAGQVKAASQRAAESVDLQTKLTNSRALAVAASSGGGASDPTIINIMARTAQEGAYRKSVALYQGEDKARDLEMQADALMAGAKSARNASYINAASSLMMGGSSLFSKYGKGGPDLESPGGESF